MISEFPLFLFTSLVGTSAAAYAASVVFATERSDSKRTAALTLGLLIVLGVGSLAVMGHLHHPERVLNALSNPRSSLTQEAYGAIALGILMLVELLVFWRMHDFKRGLRILGAVVAVVLVCFMAHAYFTMYGNVAFAAAPTIPFFVVCTLALGSALLGVVFPNLLESKGFAYANVVLQALSAATLFWEAAHFIQCGFGAMPFVCGGVLSLAAAAASFAAFKKPGSAKVLGVVVFALILVAVLAARYAFYAAGLYVI